MASPNSQGGGFDTTLITASTCTAETGDGVSIATTTTVSSTSQANKVNEENIDLLTEKELVDRLITMSTQDEDEDECSNGEYQSASEGEDDAQTSTTDLWSSSSDDKAQTNHEPGQKSQFSEQTHRSNEEKEVNASRLAFTDCDKPKGETDAATKDSKLFDDYSDPGASGDGIIADNIDTKDSKKRTDSVSELDEEKLKEAARLEKENTLTEEERQVMLSEAVNVKNEGNTAFKNGQFKEALELYSRALELCPLKFTKQRAIMLSNRAACYGKEENYEEVVKDCTRAIDCDPTYIKAINRRAEAYERLEKLDEALKDHRMILELDRSQAASFHACMKLEKQIEERNEKLKAEMLGKLKELGNMVLRPFGLSTNNFQINQDPVTGSYSCQFVQSPPSNGK